ncbi:hypothetical protein L3i20_v214980 [Paenibacillus sp. L3-i20]|nr:hypothetical protein L3i20_v214980 [Paenibacillus sp. L3-i20]
MMKVKYELLIFNNRLTYALYNAIKGTQRRANLRFFVAYNPTSETHTTGVQLFLS